MKPNISEFSYGFALTNELVQSAGPGLRAAPVFPSLYREGRPGGGWDVRLDRPGVPLFLQFKLSDCMIRPTCKEVRDRGFSLPCYRMQIRKAPSLQHQMLLDLESTENEVFYVAPAFHEPDELNNAFLAETVRSRSIWVRPSQIGPITDNEDHHVSFERVGAWAFFSEPKLIDGPRNFENVSVRLEAALRHQERSPLREGLPGLAEKVEAIGRRRSDIRGKQQDFTLRDLANREPIERVAHYASVFLECQFFVVQRAP